MGEGRWQLLEVFDGNGELQFIIHLDDGRQLNGLDRDTARLIVNAVNHWKYMLYRETRELSLREKFRIKGRKRLYDR